MTCVLFDDTDPAQGNSQTATIKLLSSRSTEEELYFVCFYCEPNSYLCCSNSFQGQCFATKKSVQNMKWFIANSVLINLSTDLCTACPCRR